MKKMKKGKLIESVLLVMMVAICLVVNGIPSTAAAVTVTFDPSGGGIPVSYTESGMTFTTLFPFDEHMHLQDTDFDGSIDLMNHGGGCCSSPYLIDFGGASFDLNSIDVVGLGFGTLTASNGSVVSPFGTLGTFFLPAGWSGITSVTWDAIDCCSEAIDNLVFNAAPVPEPSTMLLLGSGLAGLGLWRRFRKTS